MQLSSSLTLYLKFFVTVFYTVFFGAWTAALWLAEGAVWEDAWMFKVVFSLAYFLGLWGMHRFFRFLKRVDVREGRFVITDYFKTIELDRRGVERIRLRKVIGPYRVACADARVDTPFSRRICFLTNTKRVQELIELYPPLKQYFSTVS